MWQSAPLAPVPWVHYPARQTLTFVHDLCRVPGNLGRVPASVAVYLRFPKDGLCTGEGGAPVLAAGDLARIQALDGCQVTITNDTYEDYCVRVVVQ